MELKDVEDLMNLVLKGAELMPPLANAYWLATEMSPDHFHGFLGFVTNPGAVGGIAGPVNATTTAASNVINNVTINLNNLAKTLQGDSSSIISTTANNLSNIISSILTAPSAVTSAISTAINNLNSVAGFVDSASSSVISSATADLTKAAKWISSLW
jgi:hypothetical protein